MSQVDDTPPSASRQPCCLLAEDEALIAFSLEAYLQERGFQVAGPFPRNADALDWLKIHTPDIALLDVVLDDGPCLAIARSLRERGVPFATYSGLTPSGETPELAGVPWLEKGAGREALVRVLAVLMAQKSPQPSSPSQSRP